MDRGIPSWVQGWSIDELIECIPGIPQATIDELARIAPGAYEKRVLASKVWSKLSAATREQIAVAVSTAIEKANRQVVRLDGDDREIEAPPEVAPEPKRPSGRPAGLAAHR